MAARHLSETDSEELSCEYQDLTSDCYEYLSNESESNNSDLDSQEQENFADMITIASNNNNVRWKNVPPQQQGRLSAANVIRKSPGITTNAGSRITDIMIAFGIVFHSANLKKIICMTNLEGGRVYGEKWKNLDSSSFEAYIGLLLLAGVYRSNGEATTSLWNSETGRHIFRAIMSLKTFSMISRVVRFDDKTKRHERKNNDKLALVTYIYT